MSNTLPIKVNLRRRRVDIDELCSICRLHEESIKHILRDYPWSSRLWLLSPLELVVDSFTRADFAHWMVDEIFPKSLDLIKKAVMLT